MWNQVEKVPIFPFLHPKNLAFDFILYLISFSKKKKNAKCNPICEFSFFNLVSLKHFF